MYKVITSLYGLSSVLTFLLVLYVIYLLIDVKKYLEYFEYCLEQILAVYSAENNPSELSSYDIKRMKREKAFDERIERLKEEVSPYSTTNQPAEELNSNVHNIPHFIIDRKMYLLPDVEVSE